MDHFKDSVHRQFELAAFPYDNTTAKLMINFPHYAVTADGRIISFKRTTPRFLRPATSNGHLYVCLVLDKRNHYTPVSLCVAQAFVRMPEDRSKVRHKDGDRSNCRADNLEWIYPNSYFEVRKNAGGALNIESRRSLLAPLKFDPALRSLSEPRVLGILLNGMTVYDAVKQVPGVVLKPAFVKTLSDADKRKLRKDGILF
ncbi:HNH endonuclease [Pseudomonas moorei]|uniref:HNH endonuclease n=1 Tax=Pseudomonas moorei TaxID=395599 RepID=UPI00200CE8D6|nr:HNH endonuclease [Pseudomonas moorei]